MIDPFRTLPEPVVGVKNFGVEVGDSVVNEYSGILRRIFQILLIHWVEWSLLGCLVQ
jgi:hypothetical protein